MKSSEKSVNSACGLRVSPLVLKSVTQIGRAPFLAENFKKISNPFLIRVKTDGDTLNLWYSLVFDYPVTAL